MLHLMIIMMKIINILEEEIIKHIIINKMNLHYKDMYYKNKLYIFLLSLCIHINRNK